MLARDSIRGEALANYSNACFRPWWPFVVYYLLPKTKTNRHKTHAMSLEGLLLASYWYFLQRGLHKSLAHSLLFTALARLWNQYPQVLTAIKPFATGLSQDAGACGMRLAGENGHLSLQCFVRFCDGWSHLFPKFIVFLETPLGSRKTGVGAYYKHNTPLRICHHLSRMSLKKKKKTKPKDLIL